MYVGDQCRDAQGRYARVNQHRHGKSPFSGGNSTTWTVFHSSACLLKGKWKMLDRIFTVGRTLDVTTPDRCYCPDIIGDSTAFHGRYF